METFHIIVLSIFIGSDWNTIFQKSGHAKGTETLQLCLRYVTDCLAQVCSATQVSLVVRKLPSHRDLLTLLSRVSRWGTHDDLAVMMTMTLRMSAVISQPHPQR